MQTTKAAVEEGVVPGGGVALLRAQAKVLERGEDARRRRGDRRQDGRPCARGAAQADRASTPASRVASSSRRSRSLKGSERPQRRDRRVRGPREGRRHRRRQGDPLGAAERGVDRGAVPHHRGGRRRQAREKAAAARRHARWRHGRHGRHGTSRLVRRSPPSGGDRSPASERPWAGYPGPQRASATKGRPRRARVSFRSGASTPAARAPPARPSSRSR